HALLSPDRDPATPAGTPAPRREAQAKRNPGRASRGARSAPRGGPRSRGAVARHRGGKGAGRARADGAAPCPARRRGSRPPHARSLGAARVRLEHRARSCDLRERRGPRATLMRTTGSNELRQLFIDFFKERGHPHLPQAPLVPLDDPTLLFTSAGMVPFKPYYSSPLPPPTRRAVTVQRCLRLTDIENVGITVRHATFFEMLGNFSFGDYFKREAIEWAWEFATKVLEMPADRLWPSVFREDDEAFDLWAKHIGLGAKRVVRLGEKDNFWGPAGGSGPCGPCSEIYWDQGPGVGCGRAEFGPGCGYVVRRLLRRAARLGRYVGIQGTFLSRLVPVVVKQMAAYEEYAFLEREEPAVAAAILEEETRFAETLEQGVARFEETAAALEKRKEKSFPGAVAFQLYDTFGFPIDLTIEM